MSYVIRYKYHLTGELYVAPGLNLDDRFNKWLGIGGAHGSGWTEDKNQAKTFYNYDEAVKYFQNFVMEMCRKELEYDPRIDELTIEDNYACLKRDDSVRWKHYEYFYFYLESR